MSWVTWLVLGVLSLAVVVLLLSGGMGGDR